MSFQNRSQPKHAQPRQNDESSTEREVKQHLSLLQDYTKQAEGILARKGGLSRSSIDKVNSLMEQADFIVEEAEEQLQVWTGQMQAAPTERHLKKFSLDKLRRLFDFEKDKVERLTEQLRAVGAHPASDVEVFNLAEDDPSDDEAQQEDASLLGPEHQEQVVEVRRAEDRLQGISRIQNQVCEVREIMKDLAGIVVEQGLHLDTVEGHAERSSDQTRGAASELAKTHAMSQNAKSATFKALVFAFLLCFLIYFSYAHETLQKEVETARSHSGAFLGQWGQEARETISREVGR